MNILTCPNPECKAVLTEIRREEVKVTVEHRRGIMRLYTQPSDRLRRGVPLWPDLRYWLQNDSVVEQTQAEHLIERFDEDLRGMRSVMYSCPHCKTGIDPSEFGWVDPLETLPRPTFEEMVEAYATIAEENVSPAIWEHYTRYGSSPSLMLESALLLEVL